MDARFLLHNTHLQGLAQFKRQDPQLMQLSQQIYQFEPPLLNQLPMLDPGIYTLGGGRQVGKTTLLKQWIVKILKSKVNPKRIAFFTGELIDDHHSLVRLIKQALDAMPDGKLNYLMIDEVTYIKDWDKAVKFLADGGVLRHTVLMLTGSDLVLMQAARMTFPGRRGKATQQDFHLYPLSFSEFLSLKKTSSTQKNIDKIYDEFNQYLIHGGYLTAINNFAENKAILPATFMTYADWIRGDMLKRGKQENYLREILDAIVKRYTSQVTWNALADDLSIDHPKTVADYCELLMSMDALYIQGALLEDKLTVAPKKARKLIFTDPFIFHALRGWLKGVEDPFHQQVKSLLKDENLCGKLVESVVVSHYRRYYPTYYIKAEGEIDIAYVDKGRFWPVEVKWTNQLRPKDLKQIQKYPNARILTKSRVKGELNNIQTIPLPLALAELELCDCS